MAGPYETALVCLSLIMPLGTMAAAYQDIRYLRIPNAISVALAVLFLPVALISPMPIADIAMSYAVGAGMLVIGAVLFWRGIFGGGDAKLLAATSIWIGWPTVGPFLFGVAIFGGLFALIIMVVRYLPKRFFARILPWLGHSEVLQQKMPYGLAIMASSLYIFPRTPTVITSLPDFFK